MKPIYFIHSNHKQIVGALVGKYSVERSSPNRDKFDVRIVELKDYPELKGRHGQTFLREGLRVRWDNEDLQSFTPLRFLSPEVMGYEGRSIMVDPDVFALSDVWELFSMDMQDKAILARRIKPTKKNPKTYWASSVMLLDNAKLKHWRWAQAVDEMFRGQRDYRDWISLELEPQETVGELDECWNAFDRLDPSVKLLLNTARVTQPWKAGLPIDYLPKTPRPEPAPVLGVIPRKHYDRMSALIRGETYAPLGFYRQHPDPNQERLFFTLLQECLDLGIVTEAMLRQEIRHNHVRRDVFEMLKWLRSQPAEAA
jgi:hypothetical protein